MRGSRAILFGEETLQLELLKSRICDLDVRVQSGLLGRAVRRVSRDLAAQGIDLRPRYYVSNEYGTVYGTTNVALAFWDGDDRLRDLNEKARGFNNSPEDVLKILRHEAGHCFCYSYKLYRTPEFRRLFKVKGHFFQTYPLTDRYVPNPWSKDFVNVTGGHYAQKHPDDDFAETFAEFLQGESWKRRYRSKPGALRKLRYVARVARQWGRREPLVKSDPGNLDLPMEQITQTLGEFLGMPMRPLRSKAAGYIDPQLSDIFRHRTRRNGVISALKFVRKNRRSMITTVAGASDAPEIVVADILDKVESRIEALDLVLKPGELRRSLVGLSALVGTLATRYTIKRTFAPNGTH